MSLTTEIYQNEYLAEGADEVNAVIRVISSGGSGVAAQTEKIVVLVVDASGSMEMPRDKINGAKKATAAAIAMLPDGTRFAVVVGNHQASVLYPAVDGSGRLIGEGDCELKNDRTLWPPRASDGTMWLVRADDQTRKAAASAVGGVRAQGGTAMSTWLDLVRDLVKPHPQAIRLAFLMTDGKNESEEPKVLDAAIARAVGVFQCDTRGFGVGYSDHELRKIATKLLGDVDIIKRPEDMRDDFRAFMDRAIGRDIPDVRLRLRTPAGATIKLLKQVAPDIMDLLPAALRVDAQTVDFPTGAWSGDESRDYHLVISVPPGPCDTEKLAARVNLVTGDDITGKGDVRAVWTDDMDRSTRMNPVVAMCTGQEGLSDLIREGLDARKQNHEDTATVKLGLAVQLAQELGDAEQLERLGRVVEIVDAEQGTVRLRHNVKKVDVMELETRSTRTLQMRRPAPPKPPEVAADENGPGS